MDQFRFGSKAKTLDNLRSQIEIGRLCPQITVERREWGSDSARIVRQILDSFDGLDLAVRSSAWGEDSELESLAGAYASLLNVSPKPQALISSVNEVFESYGRQNKNDEVLVQPMVQNVAISGVVLTRDLDTGSPYYVINYESGSGRTDIVTSGKDSNTVLVHRARPYRLRSPRMRQLIDSVIEIETITCSHELDIEFCITESDEIFILQVRRLAARSNWTHVTDQSIDSAIDGIRSRIAKLSRPDPDLAGNRSILTEMTDWNPAEMIGNAPRPLALSLYKTLITDSVWSEARAQMGYRWVSGPLLQDFHGRPFIDVRKTFNSFLPEGIDRSHAEMIVCHQLDVLQENRDLHDKVEFAIAVTCRDFEAEKMDLRLAEAGLSSFERKDVSGRIDHLTSTIVNAGAKGLGSLVRRANSLLAMPEPDYPAESLNVVRSLCDICRENGTLPFGQLARHGFIGVQLLHSLEARGVFDSSDVLAFMHGVRTIATDLIRDMNAVHAGSMDVDAFMQCYGHLRPGTYDITSWRYEERPDLYLAKGLVRDIDKHTPFEPTPLQRRDIQALVDEAGFEIDTNSLLNYMAAAIQGREQSKFAFTRVVSNALKLITDWGHPNELNRDDLSFLPIGTLLATPDPKQLQEIVAREREAYNLTRALRLPHVILDADDIDVVRIPLGQPTFVSGKSITAKGYLLTGMEPSAIDNRIVLIESADPGFDWVFSHRILGLITKYGGANSHMAIRCAELGLPAAIGCGERLFKNLSKAQTIELNAAARKLSCH